tara:strand:+ start:9457 stop:9630 length:174 start_codon:yes stop_codon:yes gene_type:complete
MSKSDLIAGNAVFGAYSRLTALLDKRVDAVFEQTPHENLLLIFVEGLDWAPKITLSN